ncbi:MAG: AMP-binding protein [Oligosphaeraceae bacterium]
MNCLIVFFLWVVVFIAVRLRYRIRVKGLDEVVKRYGRSGILFLPNHPALIDPVILSTVLWRRFHPRALVTEKQVRATILRRIGWRIRVLPLPDLGVAGMAGHDAVLAQIERCVEALKAGDNLLFYPAGRIYRSRQEKLRGNGGVSRILQEYPSCKVVLVRTTGLWGSDFGRAKGYQLPFGVCLKRHFWHVILGGVFFMPRRPVTIEFVTRPDDLPDGSEKELLNRYLENFYNRAMRPNTYVPYTWFEGGRICTLPEPDACNSSEDTSRVPDEIRVKVKDKLREMTGKRMIRDTDTLGTDLGLDSLVVVELQQWISQEFGKEVPSPEKLRTVASLLIAAMGESAGMEPLLPVPAQWFYDDPRPLTITPADSIPLAFLKNARKAPGRPVWADQTSGVFTNQKMVLAVMALTPRLQKLPGDRLGILMPGTVAATLMYLAAQFAGKVPVMLNWTVGNRNLRHCVEASGLEKILTARVLVERLKGTGVDFTGLEDRFVMVEDIRESIGLGAKLLALFRSRFWWRKLWKAPIPKTAVILFTSGSETLPKAVPLTHENLLTDVTHAAADMGIQKDYCLLGMLPPFHSFGTLLSIVFPCASNIRVVYHPNPTEGAMLARITAAYKVNFFCGTPTFVANILRNGTSQQLEALRLVVCGAEKCPDATFRLLHEKAPLAELYEGYGITECGPVVSLNKPGRCRMGTIGKLLPCTQGVVMDEDCRRVLPAGETGMLVVCGDTIFGGYLGYKGTNPFLVRNGRNWYRTGDLVQMDDEGYITFKGRLKRFVKIGGEMVSLPALEASLLNRFPNPDAKGPALAVEAYGPDASPVVTLVATAPLTREEVNNALREEGFSSICFVREIRVWPEIPMLGTGKTDYRTIRSRLETEPASPN